MRFEFATPTKIIFGRDTLREIAPLGRRAFLVTGRDIQRAAILIGRLKKAGADAVHFSIGGEPSVAMVKNGVALARKEKCDFVVGFGGGSALDAGKAIAALLTNSGDIFDYLEVVGRGRPLPQPGAPFIAIPTTAGTGSEVTRNAVLFSPEHQVKVSMRSPHMLARVALIDSTLTVTLPPAITASTGMDALTQLIEPYVSCRANPITDALCKDGIVRAARSLRRAWENGDDADAREDMALASLFGGLALSNAGLGAAHGFAGPIGGMFDAPHGAVCAALLPHVMRANLSALRERAPQNGALQRYAEIAQWLTGHTDANAEAGVEWVSSLVATLKIPTLSAYGIHAKHLEPLVDKAMASSSMKANPLALTRGELAGVVQQAL